MGYVEHSSNRYGVPWLEYRFSPSLLPSTAPNPITMWRYRDLLPIGTGPIQYPIPIGGTPLLSLPHLRARVGLPNLYVKDETWGPSASNKDRATALVLEDGLRRGAEAITAASTGNVAVSTAFGAAAVGLRAFIFVTTDCDRSKLALMRQAHAVVFGVRQGYEAATDVSRKAAQHFGWLDRNTGTNPLTTEAKKTVALEIWEQLGRRQPDVMVVPVGDGTTLGAIFKGFLELAQCNVIRSLPRLIGIQSTHCQPLVCMWGGRKALPGEIDPARTVADGIAVTRPACGNVVLDAVRQTSGTLLAVSEDAILQAVAMLAEEGGLIAEPAGAAALAGVNLALEKGIVDRSDLVTILVTGRELKPTTQTATNGSGDGIIDGRLEEVIAYLNKLT